MIATMLTYISVMVGGNQILEGSTYIRYGNTILSLNVFATQIKLRGSSVGW
jgi:hypothetical protein